MKWHIKMRKKRQFKTLRFYFDFIRTCYDESVRRTIVGKGVFVFMIKTYVIDTNVLIQAPYALECFEDNHLVLPLVVLEELDGLKKAEGEKGANARAAVAGSRASGRRMSSC